VTNKVEYINKARYWQ